MTKSNSSYYYSVLLLSQTLVRPGAMKLFRQLLETAVARTFYNPASLPNAHNQECHNT